MSELASLIGFFAIVATLLPFSRRQAWWVRIFDFPRLQIAILAAFSGLALWPPSTPGTFGVLFAIMLAGCTAYQVAKIFPYTPFAAKEVQTSRAPTQATTLRLICANVERDNRDVARLLDIVTQNGPDLVLAIEPDERWQAGLRRLAAAYPYRAGLPLDNTYGMLLYSRLELVAPEVRFLVQPDVPSIHVLVRLRNGRLVGLHCLHPRPPVPPRHERSTERDAELLVVGRDLGGSDLPQIVMGDLNDVAWSRTTRLFRKVSGLLDPRRGRGFYNTFHARIPPLRFPVDHVFHSHHFRLVNFERLPYFGSDHFPVLIGLSLEPAAASEQARAPPDAEEQARARAMAARPASRR